MPSCFTPKCQATTTQHSARALFHNGLTLMHNHPEERGLIHQAVHEWYRLFHQLTQVDAFEFNATPDIRLPAGTALGLGGAAFCLLEAQRTAVFLRGIEVAIRDLQQRFSGERIRILYAGCGPFAALVTPLTARFPAAQVGWRLLDINPASLRAAEHLHQTLELQPYLLGTELADASRLQLRQHPPYHLIVSETMQRALNNETQLAIMLNLLPQLQPGGLFLPQRIAVRAELARSNSPQASLPQPAYQHLATLYQIGQNFHAAPRRVEIDVPQLQSPGDLHLTTEVEVYGDERLSGNDTSITLPLNMHRLLHGGERLSFTYRWQPRPRFHCELM